MSQVTLFDGGTGSLKMTSQEIADLVEKRHDNVKRTIETLVNQGVIKSPQFEEIPTATRPALVYVFSGERGKRDSIVVVAQLSPVFTARLVDRWQELEANVAAPVAAVVQDPEVARLVALRAGGALSEFACEVAAFHLLGLVHPSEARASEPAPAPARVRAQKPEPVLPKPVKIGKVRGREHGPGISLALHEVSDHCGVPMDRLMHSMYTHGLLTEGGTPTKKGREFVQSTRLGRRYWKLGALLRYLA